MDKLVSVREWQEAAAIAADPNEVRWSFGYRLGRRLPRDNPIFRPLRKLLRERGEWHGTVVQLQKQLGDGRHPTVFGRLLQQAIPFLAAEFRCEKHTMPNWGVVQFFVRRGQGKCRTKGCFETGLARGRCLRCFTYLHANHPGWTDDAELLRMRPCCFKDCPQEPDPDILDYEGDYLVCPDHLRLVQWRMMLEDCIGPDATRCCPWDGDWLSARFFHELRKTSEPGERMLFDRVYGDTPLFKIFMRTFDAYDPFLGVR